MKYIDIRSDTVTQPTQEMREAMFKAEVGDDVYDEDPTMKKLEKYAAEVVGKEDALFVPSGTFGNQLSIFTHCERGNEVILDDSCHIVVHEVGAASVIASVQLRTINSDKGVMSPKSIKKRIRKGEEDLHFPSTGLICLENAHSNGTVVPLENMKEISEIAHENEIPVHLDGARVFNAATYLNVDPTEITQYCDSVMFCLSKGLCAPVGSIVAGSKDFIQKAKKKRKLMGGGLRQAGFLAAAGLIALEKMRFRLKEDHENARYLGERLSEIPEISLNLDDIHINMVFFTINEDINFREMVSFFLEKGIKINPPENGEFRFVTNYWVSKKDVDYIVETMKEYLKK
ncbi:threonine aldolase [Petrotoga sp. 9T1HF07.CasAA.8.2]|uniref:low-specificity L-threonine aldolase n=1 Tax=unclassified Petrotoga TaxID=2620614 RepID=UPI000CC2D002|nr:low-specificity L-threonine aldolase [Petrotoga sp. 9T1HF07.CasAA.8.2]MBL5981198.1 threonine aldolase [Petrotoga sp. 8T1HF07.NaAc.6.1]PNR88626.1 threonine aldolase [Petrotoga sp. 9T1HF07.CasAA.8.2]